MTGKTGGPGMEAAAACVGAFACERARAWGRDLGGTVRDTPRSISNPHPRSSTPSVAPTIRVSTALPHASTTALRHALNLAISPAPSSAPHVLPHAFPHAPTGALTHHSVPSSLSSAAHRLAVAADVGLVRDDDARHAVEGAHGAVSVLDRRESVGVDGLAPRHLAALGLDKLEDGDRLVPAVARVLGAVLLAHAELVAGELGRVCAVCLARQRVRTRVELEDLDL
eukprot:5576631-Pleurochrysis_carterae.AAC.2